MDGAAEAADVDGAAEAADVNGAAEADADDAGVGARETVDEEER
jgi:hypothetical protein